MAREINLVPDIKEEMIRALKLRNLIFFVCIVVASASVAVTVLFGIIAGGQQLAIDSKKATLEELSNKINSYSDLNDFLTVKSQLQQLSTLSSNKKVLSRTFNILSALLPTGADTITVSELNVNLDEERPTISFDGQANAGQEPYIDFNVLDAFKKSMDYMRYDYGRYVDVNGNEIPAYCMTETDENGILFNDPEKGLYAFWAINGDGCNPSSETKAEEYATEEYNGVTVVRIWRTPQFKEWYKETQANNVKQPYMSLDGQISNVPHFESACISYSGEKTKNSLDIKWTETNDSCLLVPGGYEEGGITISDSSMGRIDGELVVRFSATISLAPEVYSFQNPHMMAIAPSGRRNVTDSYVQLQSIFAQRASDCDKDDTECSNSSSNSSSTSNTNNTNKGEN